MAQRRRKFKPIWRQLPWLYVTLTVLTIVLVVGGIAFTARGSLSESQKRTLSEAAAEIGKLKSEAEQWAHRIKGDYNKGSQQYETSYNKYIEAKAGTDAWLDRFSIDLTARRDISSSKEYQTALDEASGKGEDFLRYARALYPQSDKSAIVDLLTPLTDVGLKIWKEFRTASAENIEEVKKAILTLKWRPFDET
jgi:hypothetical protein